MAYERTREEIVRERDEVRAEIDAYALGDRPPSPPVRLIRLWRHLNDELAALATPKAPR